MGIFGKVGSFLKREAKDLGDGAEDVKDKLDQELTKREQDLKMTPSEKIAALQQQASATDDKLETIADKAAVHGAMANAVAEVGAVSADAALPNITHIVLSDGRVKSGNDVAAQVIDDQGAVRDVPLVDVPIAMDLQQPDTATAAPQSPPIVEDLPVPPPPIATEPATKAIVEDLPAPPPPTPTEPAVAAEPAGDEMGDPSSPDYGKTPAQLKYERARAAASELLDELRGELKDEGEI
jgi:hypothetical protein